MARDRFFELRTNLHLVNNLERPANNNDSFYKVRPIHDVIRSRCRVLEPETILSIDEGIIPFTGKHKNKQYIKGKPCPWGIKMFMICGKSGQVYDFLFYQGSTTELDKKNLATYGLGASVVLKLCEIIHGKNGHTVYFDNFFTTYSLLQALAHHRILACGTIRINRFSNPPLPPDREILKRERGCTFEVSSADNIVVVKWVDNKVVNLASNFVGGGIPDQARRYDKKEKQYVQIDRPEIVKLYNYGMGGVDLFDQMISYYRTFLRSRKWPLRLITHGADMAVTLSWMEYLKDAQACKIPKKDILDLLEFRVRVTNRLLYYKRNVIDKKRGRPNTSKVSPTAPVKKRKFLN